MVFAVFSNSFIIYLAVLVILIPVILLKSRVRKYLLVFFFSSLHLLNVADIVIYKFWGFHINPMVLNIIFTPGGISSLNQSLGVEWILMVLVVLAIVGEIFVAKLSCLLAKRYTIPVKVLVIFLISSVLVDKLAYAFSSLYDIYPILKHRDTLPLYQPLTIAEFASKYLGFDLDKKREFSFYKSKGRLDYPKKEIVFAVPQKKPNILLIVIDSMRYDMLNEEVTPNIFKFSKKAFSFKNHYSGGNATRFGIFSLFYGIYGNYWFDIVAEKRSPVLIEVLKKQGYNFAIFSSTKLTFPEFRKTCFVDIDPSNIYDNPPEGDGAKRDLYTTENVIRYLKSYSSPSPFFVFVFFDAPHGSYDYLKEFERFKPSHGVALFKLNKENVLPLFNKYKNSIYFDDYLIGRIIEVIKASSKLENTLIIITADHGEAFFEKGYYGHNHSYSDQEIKVPLVFYIPKAKPKEFYHKTSHLDIPPTLLRILGVKNEITDYSQGRDIFLDKERDFIPAFSWDNAAMIYDNFTVVIPFSSYGGFVRVYRNSDWRMVEFKDFQWMDGIKSFKDGLRSFKKER